MDFPLGHWSPLCKRERLDGKRSCEAIEQEDRSAQGILCERHLSSASLASTATFLSYCTFCSDHHRSQWLLVMVVLVVVVVVGAAVDDKEPFNSSDRNCIIQDQNGSHA